MAKKPKESGFTLIENGLYDAMMLRQFSSYEYRVLMFIIRKTIGWHKSEDWISLSQFSKATNIKESHVSRALSMLLKQNIITKGGNRYHPLYGVQDKYWLWVDLPKGVRSHHENLPKGDSKKGVKGLTKGGISNEKRGGTQNTIYVKTKKLVTKGGNKEVEKKKLDVKTERVDNQEIEQARFIRDIIENFTLINPAMKRMYGNTVQRQACIDLIREYTFERVMFVIEKTLPATNKKEFFPTILTPLQLFDKWKLLESSIVKYKGKLQNNKPKGKEIII